MKKLLSIVLSTILAMSVISAGTAFASDDYYLFAYFTGNAVDEQTVHFAVSDDGLNFRALNANKPFITQNKGTKCARDPYIFKGQDGYYYIIATDMDASTGAWWDNSNTFVIWRSADLINWGDEFIFDMYDMYDRLGVGGTIHCTWAPQVIWDSAEKKYMVYFALADEGISNSGAQIMYYMYTSDLMDFSKYETPQVLYKAPDKSAIDGDIIYNSADRLYYLYYKDESSATICYVTSSTLNGGYSQNPVKVYDGETALEGCNCHFVNGKLVMLADAYANGYFVAMESSDFRSFTPLSPESYSINQLSPRHGSVIKITQAEYSALCSKFKASDYTDIQYALTDNYSVESGWDWHTYKDKSGHYFDIATTGKTDIGNGSALLKSSNIFISENAVHSLLCKNKYTLSFKFKLNEALGAKIAAIASDTEDYIAFYDNGYLIVNNFSILGNVSLETNREYSVYLTYNGSTVALYLDGIKAIEKSALFTFPELGKTGYIGLGFSDKGNPKRVNAVYSNIRFRDRVLSESEINDEYNYKEPVPTPTPAPVTPTKKVTVKRVTIKKAVSGKKKFTVYFKKLGRVSGYQLQYATNSKFKKAKTVKLKRTLTKKTVKKLKSKKKYYVRIRAYKKAGGKTYYGKWSKTKTVKVK